VIAAVRIAALVLCGAVGCACTPMPCSGEIAFTEGACTPAPAPDSNAAWVFLGGVGAAPTVHLFAHGDCDNGKRIMLDDRSCVYGATYNMDVYVAPVDWRTTIGHEFLHVVLGRQHGDRDADHRQPEWSEKIDVQAGDQISNTGGLP